MTSWKVYVKNTSPEAEELRLTWAKAAGKEDLDSVLFYVFEVTDAPNKMQASFQVAQRDDWDTDFMRIVKVEEIKKEEKIGKMGA